MWQEKIKCSGKFSIVVTHILMNHNLWFIINGGRFWKLYSDYIQMEQLFMVLESHFNWIVWWTWQDIRWIHRIVLLKLKAVSLYCDWTRPKSYFRWLCSGWYGTWNDGRDSRTGNKWRWKAPIVSIWSSQIWFYLSIAEIRNRKLSPTLTPILTQTKYWIFSFTNLYAMFAYNYTQVYIIWVILYMTHIVSLILTRN